MDKRVENHHAVRTEFQYHKYQSFNVTNISWAQESKSKLPKSHHQQLAPLLRVGYEADHIYWSAVNTLESVVDSIIFPHDQGTNHGLLLGLQWSSILMNGSFHQLRVLVPSS